MKGILFFLFSICFYNSALATDPTISFGCSGGGTACTFTEPCLSSTYSAVITDGDYLDGNVYSKKITWTATANAYSNESGQGTTLYSLTWNNTDNSTTKSISVSVTYKNINQALM